MSVRDSPALATETCADSYYSPVPEFGSVTTPATDERDPVGGDERDRAGDGSDPTLGSPTGAGEDATPAFRQELVASVRASDLAVLLAVPVLLLAIFTLPESTRRSLAFAYADPTAVTAFTAHYVHLDVGHLAGNVAGYALLAGVGYALAVLGDSRRFFLTALATFLLVFPFVLSALNLAVPRDAIGFGFSGINMRSRACFRCCSVRTPASGSTWRGRSARCPRSSSHSSVGSRCSRFRCRRAASVSPGS